MAELKRSIRFPALVLYGTGTMVGAGFYALVGKVAASAGVLLPLALLVAATVALFAVLSYSELSKHYPMAGGAAVFAERGFNRRWVGSAVGWAVMLTGIVSAATLAHAFQNYLGVFVELPDWIVLLGFTLLLGALTAWGIEESVNVAVTITVLETVGLLVVAGLLLTLPQDLALPDTLLPGSDGDWLVIIPGVISGGFLAIYAFLGFEDMVNVAEEVQAPKKTMPRALLWSLGLTTGLYLLVSSIAVLAVPLETLVESEAPLADIVRAQGEGWRMFIGVAGLLAGVNGALVQFIMGSRILYGMADEGMAPRVFDKVNARTRTPIRSTIVVTVVIAVLAIGFPLETLARTTSFIVLFVFAAMHGAVLRLRLRAEGEWATGLPVWVPVTGLLIVAALLIFQVQHFLAG
ncbi:MAG: APC family permease [Gammaproteobacteria bacterium]|nr:APC family permease [Gammaproteobacteria bacterium]